MFKGSMVALVTPFNKDGSLDEKSFKDLINWHIQAKTDAIVLSGTTGEAPTLLDEEKLKIFQMANDIAKGKTKIIAGTGTYSTEKSKFLTEKGNDLTNSLTDSSDEISPGLAIESACLILYSI